MAVFDSPAQALQAALKMHEVLVEIVSRGSERGASTGLRSLRRKASCRKCPRGQNPTLKI
jgi:hypothetical protein